MSYHLRYAARIYNTPLLITSDKGRVLESIIRAHEEHRASLLSPPPVQEARRELVALAGDAVEVSRAGYLRTSDGVAIIQTVGTMVQRGSDEKLDAMSGLVSYSTLATQMRAAVNDPRVDAVLWEIDSDGGEVSGLVDATAAVRALAKQKPIWAIANEKALSAAMWVGTAASRLVVTSTGVVGSIGVRMFHVDQSQRDAKQGLVYTELAAGAHKTDFSTHAPLSDSARQTAQEMLDRTYAMFVAAVAEHRGIDEQVVRDTEAALLSPAAALSAGLVDGIQSFDETLRALTAEAKYVRKHGMRVAAAASSIPAPTALQHDEGADMDSKELETKLADAESRGVTKGKTEAAAATAQQVAEAASKAAAEAQTRISTILSHAEATDRRTLAEHLAFKTTSSAEDAIAMLAVAPKAAAAPTNMLAAAMGKIDNPKVGASNVSEVEETAVSLAASILSAGKPKLAAVK